MSTSPVIILLGSDPEIFVQRVVDGKPIVVSGIDLIQGDKDNPHPITDEGHCIQVDNVAWEFNIPPCDSAESYVANINLVLSYLKAEAAKHGLELSKFASFELAKEELQHPTAQRFGCEPDFNVYTSSHNPSPNTNTNLRVVGGHVHIGYPDPNVETTEKIVKLFDIFLTAPAVAMDPDTRRRELYGKPGSFRFKDFGVECRALSNFWIHNEETIKWVFNTTSMLAMLAVTDPEKAEDIILKYSDRAVQIVNDNNVEEAKSLTEELKTLV